jgi:hypothetical protein
MMILRKTRVGRGVFEGNRFFQNYRGEAPDRGEVIILLTDTDFVYGPGPHPYYLRRGTAFPWR